MMPLGGGGPIGFGLLVGVVGAADERTRFDLTEADCEGVTLEIREVVGVVIACDRQVRGGWAKVLADRQDLATDRPQVGERAKQFVGPFPPGQP